MAGRKTRQVVVAALILAVLVIAALWVGMRDRTDKVASSLLYPGLAEQTKTAERVQLFVAGDQLSLDLARSGDLVVGLGVEPRAVWAESIGDCISTSEVRKTSEVCLL